jgi:hypothetical protein
MCRLAAGRGGQAGERLVAPALGLKNHTFEQQRFDRVWGEFQRRLYR